MSTWFQCNNFWSLGEMDVKSKMEMKSENRSFNRGGPVRSLIDGGGEAPLFFWAGVWLQLCWLFKKRRIPYLTQDLCFHCPSLMHVLSHATIVITLNKIGYYQNESWSWELENNGDQWFFNIKYKQIMLLIISK